MRYDPKIDTETDNQLYVNALTKYQIAYRNYTSLGAHSQSYASLVKELGQREPEEYEHVGG